MVLQVEIPLISLPSNGTWLIKNKVYIEPSIENSFQFHGNKVPMTSFYCLTNKKSELFLYLLNFIQLIGCLSYEGNLTGELKNEIHRRKIRKGIY